jgi:formylglycine-generating enzyme required for sulfatase activity
MDVAEISVGRFRDLLEESPGLITELPEEWTPTGVQAGCTWLGPDSADNDDLPLSCVSGKTASEVCAALGGRLPTEAEWEHAARGRGRRWRYPWGNEWPECCTAIAGGQGCGRNAPEPAGNSSNALSCATRDVSRDGVFDLAGNLGEITSDRLVSYAEGCWGGPGVTIDPSCTEPEHAPLVVRGGVYNEPATFGAAPVRRLFTEAYGVRAVGIRCVHTDGAER